MIVVVKDAENRFLDDLKKFRHDQDMKRCYYLAFSRINVPRQDLFEKFIALLHDVPDSYRAQVYICADKDVFILMQGFMQRQFAEFINHLGKILQIDNINNYAEVMELAVHWSKIEVMCERKREKIQIEKEKNTEEKRKNAAKRITIDALSTLDANLLSSISQRRSVAGNISILVVDDDQIVRTLVGNVIRENYDCRCVKDGKTAISEYVSCAPDLVFLDIGLPDIDGYDILETLFQIDPDANIIMFSGRKSREDILRALELGAQGFIGKPFTREKLFQYIDRSPHVLKKGNKKSSQSMRAHS